MKAFYILFSFILLYADKGQKKLISDKFSSAKKFASYKEAKPDDDLKNK